MKKKKSQGVSPRHLRMADQIQKDLSKMIAETLPLSVYGMVTIQSIDLTSDFSVAKVFYTLLGGDYEKVQTILNQKSGYFHAQLFKLLSVHTIPRLKFIFDTTTEKAYLMDALIASAVSKETSPQSLETDRPKNE